MKVFLKISLFLLLCSCAQQAPITGGIKDTIAPEIIELKTQPKNLSTQFESKKITLEFDEYIKLKNTSKNFFVNPPIDQITVEEANKSITIAINEPLKEKTTYTFNFGSAIEDITEGNVLEDFKYVVSTGNYIDSNFFDGFAYDAFLKTPLEKTKVFLFEQVVDTFNTKVVPSYFSFVKESGDFTLSYLTNQSFYLVAIEDKNDNNKYDAKTEKIGFIEKEIHSVNIKDTNSISPSVLLFSPEKKLKLIDKQYLYPGKVLLLFNKKTDAVSVSSKDRNLTLINKTHPSDSLEFWLDSISSKIFNATISSPLLDSSKAFSITMKSPKEVDSTFAFKQKNLSNLKPGSALKLEFNHPILSVDTAKINFLKDSVGQPINYSISSNIFSLLLPANNSGPYKLNALPGAFNSIYGFTNDSTAMTIKPKKESDYGSIYFSVTVKDSTNFITQILKNNKVVETFYSSTNLLTDTLYMCNPDNYNIRVIKDLDKNNKWTTGDFFKKRLAEEVVYYNKPIEIKAGWDVEVSWEIK